MERLLGMLRAAGDPTRLRLLFLLVKAELTVSEITEIIGQSQPRVSRHLKLLCDAGLLERVKEGAWVFYRGADGGDAAELARGFAQWPASDSDAVLRGDQQRLAEVRAERAQRRRNILPRMQRIGKKSVPCTCRRARWNALWCACCRMVRLSRYWTRVPGQAGCWKFCHPISDGASASTAAPKC